MTIDDVMATQHKARIDRRACIHVYPTFGRPHDTDHGDACWCQPEPLADEPNVLVHHPEQ